MELQSELAKLKETLDKVPDSMLRVFGQEGAPMYLMDLILTGATKRTLGLGHGLLAMIKERNMLCGRALVRMQIDTVSRVLAYTYVADREDLAKRVIGGEKLRSFKCRDGKKLTDQYLIERLAQIFSWVPDVYDRTSASVHFSEQQFFSSVSRITDDENGRRMSMVITQVDTNYPESSWSEITACFNELTEFFIDLLDQYSASKNRG